MGSRMKSGDVIVATMKLVLMLAFAWSVAHLAGCAEWTKEDWEAVAGQLDKSAQIERERVQQDKTCVRGSNTLHCH